MFAALFWDNDGVLMDTEHLYYQANAEALSRAGVTLSLTTFTELSLRRGESVLQLAPHCEEELRHWRDHRYRELLASGNAVIPGVEDTLKRLYGTVPVAIVTSCRRVNFEAMHHSSGLLDYMDFVLTREDYANSKPDPEPYLTACARAGLPPARCLAIEDSQRGVVSASRAGLSVAAIPGALNAGSDFSAATWRLERIDEVPDLLDRG